MGAHVYERSYTPEGPDAIVARIAGSHHGVFTRTQAHEVGLTDGMIHRRIETGRCERVHVGVYRMTGHRHTWKQALMVACFACGDGAVASHGSAASLRALPGFPANAIELSTKRTSRRALPFVVHHPRSLDPVDIEIVDAIPVTTTPRTLIDIAGTHPTDVVEEALDDALRRGLVSISRLRWRLRENGGKGRPGAKVLAALLDARTDGIPESVFETRLLRELRRARLPRPQIQHEIFYRRRMIARVDFAYPDRHVAIEADGYRFHSSRQRWDRDVARRNQLVALGWKVINVTWTELNERPRDVVGTIRLALR